MKTLNLNAYSLFRFTNKNMKNGPIIHICMKNNYFNAN